MKYRSRILIPGHVEVQYALDARNVRWLLQEEAFRNNGEELRCMAQFREGGGEKRMAGFKYDAVMEYGCQNYSGGPVSLDKNCT